MSATISPRRRALATLLTGAVITALATAAVPGILPASADPTSITFTYSDSVQTLTVPEGITQLKVSMLGAEGGEGGADSIGPIAGGYRGLVTGTLAVTPGEVLTIGVGHGGFDGETFASDAAGGVGGGNPIDGYTGGTGGLAGVEGFSGGGAGGGGATVLKIDGQTIVAGGGGGGGGSGQFGPTAGRPGASTFTASADPTTGVGADGLSVDPGCIAGIRCDGGGSGAGGGGAIGGGPGQIAYGAGDSTEYFGYGGSPGANNATGLTSGSAVYQYYGDNGADGSITFTYDTSAPTAPSGVSATGSDGSAKVSWLAPLSDGGGAITDYTVQYAADSGDPDWQTLTRDPSTLTSAVVEGLSDGTDYVFRIAAINSFGTSDYSDPSAPASVSRAPDAPVLNDLASSDGALTVSYTKADEVAGVDGTTDYQYQLNGGEWTDAGMYSPFVISSLDNGTEYSVAVRAVNPIGPSAASNTLYATPLATPSAPTITSIATGVRSATISFSPGYAGGSPITGYSYSLNGGAFTSAGADANTFSIAGLANGTDYQVALRADSAAGSGDVSGSSSFTTPGMPGAVTINGITAGDGSLSVDFSLGSNGGLAIDELDYQLVTGGPWLPAGSLASPLELSGLTNGTTYQIALEAHNAAAWGWANGPTSATPITTPGAPQLLDGSVAGGDQQLVANFTAPASDGGATINSYEYSTDGGVSWRERETGTTETPLVISTQSDDGTTPLVNGNTYPVEVRAVNAAGPGTSSGVADGIARTVPDAPGITSVSSLPGALRVHFSSASNGGSPITAYEYRVNLGGWTSTGSLGSSFSIPSLTDGTRYAVQVRAINAVGTGAASQSAYGTPSSQPGQASITSITSGDRQLTVGGSLTSIGGSAITSWQYSTDNGNTWATASGASSPFTITTRSSDGQPLTNGASYAVALRAVNAAGTGAASTSQVGIPMTTPAAPLVSITPQNGALAVAFTAGDLGGSPLNGVQYSIGAGWISLGSLQSVFVIPSLSNGTTYLVQVRLANAAGAGTASDAASATPRTVPTAPRSVTAAPDDNQATVSWNAPAFDGGSAITGYTATAWSSASSGSAIGSCTTTETNCVITGLTNLVASFISVTATNDAGSSVESATRVAVVPAAKPGAPLIYGVAPSNTFLTVYYADGDQGTFPTTGIQYSLNGGDWTTAAVSNPLVISGLTNGTTYTVTLRETSIAGAGAPSNTDSATPFGVADVPDASEITVTPGYNSALVTWAAPANNGSNISQYNVIAWSSATQGHQLASCSAYDGDTSCTLNVNNSAPYYVTVDATNAAGTTPRSDPRVAVDASAPAAVTDLLGVPGDQKVTLTWTPPASSGASDITGYQVLVYSPWDGWDFVPYGDVVADPTATISGLTNGYPYQFEVVAVNAFGSSTATYTDYYWPAGAGVAPTFTTPVSTADGFTATITNDDGEGYYSVSTDAGTVDLSGDTITVSGLDAGQQASVAVTASAYSFTDATATLTGSALSTGTQPTFSVPSSTADGFTVQLLNPVDGASYTPGLSDGADGNVSMDGTTITVTGLTPGESATVTVDTRQDGHTSTLTDVTGTALDTGIAPLLGDPVRTADGFTITLLDPDLLASYSASASAGTLVIDGDSYTVTGLDAGETATISVVESKLGYTDATSTVDGSALDAAPDLNIDTAAQTSDGFTFAFAAFDSNFTYSATVNVGTLSFANGVGTVSGLANGQVATVFITATQDGHQSGTTAISWYPLPVAGTDVVLSTPVSITGGFTTTITNFSDGSDYTVQVDAGQVSRDGATITVTGLTAGQSATVTVMVDRLGYWSAFGTMLGRALDAVTPTDPATPVVPVPTPAPAVTPAVAILSSPVITPGADAPATAGESSGTKDKSGLIATPPVKTAGTHGSQSAWVPIGIGALILLMLIGLAIAFLRRRAV